MKVDQAGLDLIHLNEGFSLTAYLDTGGVWTIGWGSTKIFGRRVRKGDVITKEQAEEQSLIDLKDSEAAVNKFVKVPLTQGQYNALVDFVYNIGEKQFASSTLLKVLNKGDYDEAAKQFMRWVYDNGVKIKGLELRRKRAVAMFNS